MAINPVSVPGPEGSFQPLPYLGPSSNSVEGLQSSIIYQPPSFPPSAGHPDPTDTHGPYNETQSSADTHDTHTSIQDGDTTIRYSDLQFFPGSLPGSAATHLEPEEEAISFDDYDTRRFIPPSSTIPTTSSYEAAHDLPRSELVRRMTDNPIQVRIFFYYNIAINLVFRPRDALRVYLRNTAVSVV